MTGQRKAGSAPKKQRRGGLRVLLLLAALCAAVFLIRGRVTEVREIRVLGSKLHTDAEIAGLSGISLGDNLFKIDKDAISRNFLNDSTVELLDVEICPPDTVVLTVRDRLARAAVNCAGVILLIDTDGSILDRLPTVPEGDIIIVNGLDVSISAQGKKIESAKKGQIENMRLILESMDMQGLTGRIAEMDVSDANGLYLISKTGVQIVLGDTNDLTDKLVWADAVLEKLTSEGVMSGVLDVSTGKNAAYADR